MTGKADFAQARVLVVDWSGAGNPSPARPSANSIWIAHADCASGQVGARYLRTRHAAEATLLSEIAQARSAGRRLVVAIDVAFGYPAGFAARLTGRARAFDIWQWLAQHIRDEADNTNNHRAVAAMMNAAIGPGDGPLWGDGTRAGTPGLPRTKPPLPPGLAAHRQTERAAWAGRVVPKPVWQLAGNGAVGAQTLLAIPIMERLRLAGESAVRAWPFEDVAAAPVILAETYLSILRAELDALVPRGTGIHDENQARLLAASLARVLSEGGAPALLAPRTGPEVLAEEGWILGAGSEVALRAGALWVGRAAL